MVGEKTADKAVGRTRGGLNTKIHAVVDGLGNPVEFLLSAGNDHDSVHAMELLEKVQICGSNVLADRAYGARTIREYGSYPITLHLPSDGTSIPLSSFTVVVFPAPLGPKNPNTSPFSRERLTSFTAFFPPENVLDKFSKTTVCILNFLLSVQPFHDFPETGLICQFCKYRVLRDRLRHAVPDKRFLLHPTA